MRRPAPPTRAITSTFLVLGLCVSCSMVEAGVAGRRFPGELLGSWDGRIVAYDREIEVTLVIGNEYARIKLSGLEEVSVDFSVVTAGFVLGTFPGSIPTPDIARYAQSVRLALVRSEDRLSGQATAVGWREDRQTDAELSSWIELVRQE